MHWEFATVIIVFCLQAIVDEEAAKLSEKQEKQVYTFHYLLYHFS